MAAIFLGAKGPCMGTVSACASSAHAIGEAVEMIRRGVLDVTYAGGCRSADHPPERRRIQRDGRALDPQR